MILTDITMSEFSEGLEKTKTLVVPFGAVEAHGTHMPLGTDTLIMDSVVCEAEKSVDFFVAPPIHYGVCTSTGAHPGTINFTPDTLRGVCRDIVRDGYRKGLRNFVLISGHGGGQHVSAMKEAGEVLTAELEGVNISCLAIYEILPKEAYEIAETKNDSHAGEIETSLILHLNETLVKGRAPEEYPYMPKPIIAKDKVKFWPGAVWGNPEVATSEKGKQFFDIMVESLVEFVKRIEKFKQ